jgi:hypothetical protein
MARILVTCPAGRGAVSTGFRTADIDLAAAPIWRSFRCACGDVHTWSERDAWAEASTTAHALKLGAG